MTESVRTYVEALRVRADSAALLAGAVSRYALHLERVASLPGWPGLSAEDAREGHRLMAEMASATNRLNLADQAWIDAWHQMCSETGEGR